MEEKTRLPVLQTAAPADSGSKFRCIPYSCEITERVCVTRQVQCAAVAMPVMKRFVIKGVMSAEVLSRCKNCEQGRGVAAGYTGVVTVTTPDSKERRHRWGNRPQEMRNKLDEKKASGT